jgi:hypothetical protein
MTNNTLEIKLTDTNSTAMTFATKLLAGTLNFFCDYEDGSGEFREVTKNVSWFSTDMIAWLRNMTSDMKISKLTFTPIAPNPRSMAVESKIRSYTLYAWDRSYKEVEVATFDVAKDYLDGDTVEGWTDWYVTNVTVKVTRREIKLVSERHEGGMYLSDVIWGCEVLPE